MELQLLLTITIIDHSLTGFLVDHKSLHNILFTQTLEKLGLQLPYMNSYIDGDKTLFNYSVNHPSEIPDATLSLREGVGE